jgi:hypothetical protein
MAPGVRSSGRGGRTPRTGRWYARRRMARCAGARALWRPMGQFPFELHWFESSKLLKIELHSKTYR